MVALVEIDQGPYLVQPIEDSYDSGERPINIDASNIVWLDSESTRWVEEETSAEISFLLEDADYRSLFVKLPSGFAGVLESKASVLHAVVIKGLLTYVDGNKSLDPGSYFGCEATSSHRLKNATSDDVVLYVRTNDELRVTQDF